MFLLKYLDQSKQIKIFKEDIKDYSLGPKIISKVCYNKSYFNLFDQPIDIVNLENKKKKTKQKKSLTSASEGFTSENKDQDNTETRKIKKDQEVFFGQHFNFSYYKSSVREIIFQLFNYPKMSFHKYQVSLNYNKEFKKIDKWMRNGLQKIKLESCINNIYQQMENNIMKNENGNEDLLKYLNEDCISTYGINEMEMKKKLNSDKCYHKLKDPKFIKLANNLNLEVEMNKQIVYKTIKKRGAKQHKDQEQIQKNNQDQGKESSFKIKTNFTKRKIFLAYGNKKGNNQKFKVNKEETEDNKKNKETAEDNKEQIKDKKENIKDKKEKSKENKGEVIEKVIYSVLEKEIKTKKIEPKVKLSFFSETESKQKAKSEEKTLYKTKFTKTHQIAKKKELFEPKEYSEDDKKKIKVLANISGDFDFLIHSLEGKILFDILTNKDISPFIYYGNFKINPKKKYDIIGEIKESSKAHYDSIVQVCKYIHLIFDLKRNDEVNEKLTFKKENEKILMYVCNGSYYRFIENILDFKINQDKFKVMEKSKGFKNYSKIVDYINTIKNKPQYEKNQLFNLIIDSGLPFIFIFIHNMAKLNQIKEKVANKEIQNLKENMLKENQKNQMKITEMNKEMELQKEKNIKMNKEMELQKEENQTKISKLKEENQDLKKTIEKMNNEMQRQKEKIFNLENEMQNLIQKGIEEKLLSLIQNNPLLLQNLKQIKPEENDSKK